MSAKKANEIYIERIYDAPLKLVWDAWTDPEQVAQWWGPRGFTLTTKSKDVRTGGSWVYTMHGPDGVDWPNNTKFLEVKKYERMVYDHGGNENQPPMFRVTVDFKELNGKTKMEMTMALATAEAAAETKKFIKKAGGDSTWDRLAEFLAKETANKELFVINRSFEAPIALLYEAFTNTKHLAEWLAPTGSTVEFLRDTIAVGSSTFYKMEGAHGIMFGRSKYLELNPPNRIVYTQQFVDKDENISRHPLAPTWPETMQTVISFAEEGANQTRVTITWEPYGTVSNPEVETFKQARGGMTQGWNGSLDKLESHLSTVTAH